MRKIKEVLRLKFYAEATGDEQLANWIGAHVRAFEFFQGVPKLVVPDNTKTGVTKACRYDPDLNPTYQEMAMHIADSLPHTPALGGLRRHGRQRRWRFSVMVANPLTRPPPCHCAKV